MGRRLFSDLTLIFR